MAAVLSPHGRRGDMERETVFRVAPRAGGAFSSPPYPSSYHAAKRLLNGGAEPPAVSVNILEE